MLLFLDYYEYNLYVTISVDRSRRQVTTNINNMKCILLFNCNLMMTAVETHSYICKLCKQLVPNSGLYGGPRCSYQVKAFTKLKIFMGDFKVVSLKILFQSSFSLNLSK